MLGNIYLGIEGTSPSSRIFGEGGIRIPLASDRKPFAAGTGIQADVRRSQAFLPNTVSIESAVNLWSGPVPGLRYRFRLSPVLEYDTERSASRFAGNYSAQVGYERPSLRIGAAISGRIIFTNLTYSILDGNLSQIEFHSDFLPGSLRPGIDVRVPLGALRQDAEAVLGANLTWIR